MYVLILVVFVDLEPILRGTQLKNLSKCFQFNFGKLRSRTAWWIVRALQLLLRGVILRTVLQLNIMVCPLHGSLP